MTWFITHKPAYDADFVDLPKNLQKQVSQLCFPLRDIFTADYYKCRGTPHLEDQFIVYYNHLFGLPEDFGVEQVWRTAPGGEIRHPGGGGRTGWYDDFLQERIPDPDLHRRARNVRRMLADATGVTYRPRPDAACWAPRLTC